MAKTAFDDPPDPPRSALRSATDLRALPWVITLSGRLIGLAASREAAIRVARQTAKFSVAAIENKLTGEVWQGAVDDWRQTSPPQRIGGERNV